MANDAPKTIAHYAATLADIAQRTEAIRATFKRDLIDPINRHGPSVVGLGEISMLYCGLERLAELANIIQMELES